MAKRAMTAPTNSDGGAQFDVFLSYDTADRSVAFDIAQALEDRGLSVWIDAAHDEPDGRWAMDMEAALNRVKGIALLVGAAGVVTWQQQTLHAALEENARRQLPIIPVLLPGAPEETQLSLRPRLAWVDLRSGLSPDGIEKLYKGIRQAMSEAGSGPAEAQPPVPNAATVEPARPNEPLGAVSDIGYIFRRSGVAFDPELKRLLGLAVEIQQARRGATTRFLSRTSVFFAALLMHEDLLALMESCGFGFAVFQRSVGSSPELLDLAKQRFAVDVRHVRMSGLFAQPIDLYAQQFPGRRMDALGLTWSILSDPAEGLLGGWLRDSGLDRRAAIDLLEARMRQSSPVAGADAPPATMAATTPLLPPFDSDGLGDRDMLGIGPSVRAFASLFASRELVPPLSVGLFGDWGSGKSFFMRKLRERVEKVSQAARTLLEDGQQTALLGNVVQIEFNAWHYAEVNLWASLVTHIFDTLNRHFSPQEGLRERWEALLRRLDEATGRQDDAQGMLRHAEDNLAEVEAQLDQRRLGLAEAVDALWQGLDEPSQDGLREIGNAIGLEEVEAIKDSLVRAGAEGQWAARRVVVFRQAALRGLSVLTLVRSYALVVLAVAVVGVGLVVVTGHSATLAGPVRTMAEAVVPLASVVGGAAAWLVSALSKGAKVATALQRVEANVRRKLRNSTEGDRVRSASRAVQAAREEVEERRRRVAEVRSQMESLRPSRWLSDFLRERATSSDYNKYLGITAIARRDFERLHELMTEKPVGIEVADSAVVEREVEGLREIDLGVLAAALNEALKGRDLPIDAGKCSIESVGADGWQVLDPTNARRIGVPRSSGATRTCTVSYDGPRIDRIVLYIDDLDRCPPRRVVEVLEAVHLLLALPLFVVVVGVDARWVTRSLEAQYSELWQGADAPGATPQDYLEKIFQIPFWLQPLDAGLTSRMLESLLRRSAGAGGEEVGTVESAARRAESSETRGGVEDQVRSADARRVEADAQEEMAGSGDAANAAARNVEAGVTGGGEDDDGFGADATANRLILSSDEIELMSGVAPLVSRSPRAVKRFVNTYRLIRAAVPPGELEEFLGSAEVPGRNRVDLALLAMVVGRPDEVKEFEAALAPMAADRSVAQGLPAEWLGAGGQWRGLVGALLTSAGARWTTADVRQELTRVSQYSFQYYQGDAGQPQDG